MSGSIECHYNPCSEIFNPKGNQRYHCSECANEGRKIKERLRKRKKRHEQYQEKIKEQIKNTPGRVLVENNGQPVRKTNNCKKYFYKCDNCNNPTNSPSRMLNTVFACTIEINKNKG